MVVAPEEEAASNGTDLYTLSVVRLADPLHAQLQLLNVTESTGEAYTLCGDGPGLEGPPVLGSSGLVDYEVPQASVAVSAGRLPDLLSSGVSPTGMLGARPALGSSGLLTKWRVVSQRM